MYSKDEARRFAGERMSRLSREEKADLSRQICRKIGESPLYRRADALFAFYPFRGEVDIVPLLEETLMRKIPLFLPLIEGKSMSFFRVEGLSPGELRPNRWGIREPDGRGNPSRGEEFKRPLMLVPGVAFTGEGVRLGRGGGYYDRFLEAPSPFLTAGVAYPVQIFETLPRETHDRILDGVFY